MTHAAYSPEQKEKFVLMLAAREELFVHKRKDSHARMRNFVAILVRQGKLIMIRESESKKFYRMVKS